MTTIAEMRDALSGRQPCPGAHGQPEDVHAVWGCSNCNPIERVTPDPDPFVPELPPATAEHGPRAARRVAQQHADAGAHSHLAAYGETVCLTRQCGPALDVLKGLL